MLSKQAIYDVIHSPGHYFTHGSTFAGNPVSCVAALEVLGIVEREGLVAKARAIGQTLQNELTKVSKLDLPWTVKVSGVGTLFEILLVPKMAVPDGYEVTLGMKLYDELLKRGQYVRVLANDLCFAPPLVSTTAEIETLGFELGQALKTVAGFKL